jgi:hypothetical protein
MAFPLGERDDIMLEESDVLDGSGNYTSPWVETSGVGNYVRVAAWFNGGYPTTQLEQGVYSSSGSPERVALHEVGTENPAHGEVPIVARYLRLVITGGTESGAYRASIRKVS